MPAPKVMETAFALAGKLMPSFHETMRSATASLGAVKRDVKAIETAAERKRSIEAWKQFQKGAKNAKAAVAGVKNEIAGTVKAMAGLAMGQGLIGGTIYGVAKSSANYADAAVKSAQGLGMSTEAYTELAYAATMAGASEQQFAMASGKVSKLITDAAAGNDKAREVFQRTGISIRDSAGNLKGVEQLWGDFSDAFASMPDGIGKTRLAIDMFGEQGAKLIPFLNSSKKGMDAAREAARQMGITLSKQDGMNAEAFNDSFANIGHSIRGVSLIAGKHLWPVFTKIHDFISGKIVQAGQELAKVMPEWARLLEEGWTDLVPELEAAWESIKSGAKAVNKFAQDMGGWVPLIKTVVKYWLAWRGVRIAESLWDTGKAVKSLGRDFLNLQYAGVSVGGAMKGFGGVIAKNFKRNTLRVFGRQWTRTFQNMAGSVGSFAGMIGGKFTSALLFLPKLFLKASLAALKFGAALLLNPIGLAVAAIAGLGVAVYACIKHWDSIKAAAQKVWAVIKEIFLVGWNMLPGWVQEPIKKVAEFVTNIGGKIWSGITKDWEKLKEYFGPSFSAMWASVSGAVSAGIDKISALFGMSGDGWGKSVSGAWESVKGVFGQQWMALKEGFYAGSKAVGDAFEESFIGGLYEIIKQFTPLGFFIKKFNEVKDWLSNFDLAQAGAELAKKLGDGVLNALSGIGESVKSAIVGWVPGGESIVNAAGAAKDAVSGAYSSATGALSRWWNGDSAATATATAAAQTIPAMANGGIVTRPQLTLIGEAGPEVVIPVTRAARARELMGKAAEMMGMGGQGDARRSAAPFGFGMMRGAAAAGLSALLSIAPAAAAPSAMPDVNVLNSVTAPAVRLLGGGDSVANYGGDVASSVGGSSVANNAFTRLGDTISAVSSLVKGGSSTVYGGSNASYGGSSTVNNIAQAAPSISTIFGDTQMATANTRNQSWLSNIANNAGNVANLSNWFGDTTTSAAAFNYGGRSDTANNSIANYLTRMGDSASGIMSAFTGGDVSNVANSFSTVGGDAVRNVLNTVTNSGQWLDKTVAQSLPAFANGGLVDSPTVGLIGEAGPEMIVPLTRENRARDLMGAAAEFMGWSGGEEAPRGGDTFEFNFSPTIQVTGGSENPERQARQIAGSLEPLIRRIVMDVMRDRNVYEQRTRNG